MELIKIGSKEITDNRGLKIECDFFLTKISEAPLIYVTILDELISTKNGIHNDKVFVEQIRAFLSGKGLEVESNALIKKNKDNQFIIPLDGEKLTGAIRLGWIDPVLNSEAAKKTFLKDILSNLEIDVNIDNIRVRGRNEFIVNNVHYLVFDLSELGPILKSKLRENYHKIEPHTLAKFCPASALIELDERTKDGRHRRELLEFNRWFDEHIDNESMIELMFSLKREHLYEMLLDATLVASINLFVVFETH